MESCERSELVAKRFSHEEVPRHLAVGVLQVPGGEGEVMSG